jgi:hypothetical protein
MHGPWKNLTVGALAALVTLSVYVGYFSVRFGLNVPTRATSDEPDYDSIAWELSQGRGFRLNYLDPEFRRPYEVAAATSDLYRLESRRQGLTTYRPPLFPFAVAGGNLLFGRQFWGMRILNMTAMAACCGILCAAVCRSLGVFPALSAAVLFLIVDARTRLYASAFLTESLAAFEAAVLTVCLVWMVRGRPWQTCVVGVLAGLMILTRSMFVFWLPWVLIVIVAMVRLHTGKADWKRMLQHGALFALTVLLILTPWGYWNCRTLQRFMPLGSQGAIELSTGWSDGAWERSGEWRSAQAPGYFEPDHPGPLSLVEREAAAADESAAQARNWILAHPAEALALIPI